MLDDARMFWRFACGLRRFLSSTLSREDCRRIIEDSVRDRERQFLKLLARAVYGYPASPYLKLLHWAGIEYGDIVHMVAKDGLEGALERLYEAGVHVRLDEFKGRCPIERPGLRVDVENNDFDNPLLAREFEVESSGSSGRRRRAPLDLDLLVHDAAAKFLALQANGAEARPLLVWRAVPPSSSGLKNVLIPAKYGNPAERWFTPVPMSWKLGDLKFAVFTAFAVGYGRLRGGAIPAPEYLPLNDPLPVARWLAGKTRQGAPGVLCTAAGPAVQVCLSAIEKNLDIAGTIFRVGGEPMTEAKARAVTQAGALWNSAWAMAESGPLGGACAHREEIDEVHLFGGKIAVF